MPAIVGPDGDVDFVDLPSRSPPGLGGMPFETVELELAEGSQLVLYTDGLVVDRHRDIDTGPDQLRTVLACAGRAVEDTLRGGPRRPAAHPPERRRSSPRRPAHRTLGTRYTSDCKIIWTEQPLL